MRLLFCPLLLLTVTCSCGNTAPDARSGGNLSGVSQDTVVNKYDSMTHAVGNTKSNNVQSPTDSLLQYYINHADNALIKSALRSRVSETWLFDQLVSTDSAKYLVYQVGHDVSDGGGRNKRFVTDQWVYIDSLTKRLYEYDLAKDSLSRWVK
jgi:hypothetical protein